MAQATENERCSVKPSAIVVAGTFQAPIADFCCSCHKSTKMPAETPKFDLESYIANYDGATRLDRLLLIGRSSKPLAADALNAALVEAKAGKNVTSYLDIIAYVQNSNQPNVVAVEDQAWVEKTRKATDRETERLESELKGYKNNLIKESIRVDLTLYSSILRY